MDQGLASDIIESLRLGRPPDFGVHKYSVGDTEFLEAIKKRHLQNLNSARGKIRFVSGSWGMGKTHFLARIRDIAFDTNCLVSSVQLDRDTTPFDRFEEVFYSVVKNISTPDIDPSIDDPLSEVFRRQLFGPDITSNVIDRNACETACRTLMENREIDIDFRKIVCKFWETYRREPGNIAADEHRGMVMDWFAGRGRIGAYRDVFGVQTMVNRRNARQILKSLVRYAIHAGFAGIVVLLDEAEMNFSTMRRSNRARAHNNLLHLINTIQQSVGLFVIFATTPDFFVDQHYGIRATGPLAQRIGRPPDRRPIALQSVWNLQYLQRDVADYQLVARKLQEIYVAAYPEYVEIITAIESLDDFVRDLQEIHSPLGLGFWRVLVQAVIRRFDIAANEEDVPSSEQIYDDVAATDAN